MQYCRASTVGHTSSIAGHQLWVTPRVLEYLIIVSTYIGHYSHTDLVYNANYCPFVSITTRALLSCYNSQTF